MIARIATTLGSSIEPSMLDESCAAPPSSAAGRAAPRPAPGAPPRRSADLRNPSTRSMLTARISRNCCSSAWAPRVVQRGRRRALEVRGAPIDVFLEQTQRRLALRDAVVQRRHMQARRVGIEAAQPQRRDRDVFGSQVPYLAAKRPPKPSGSPPGPGGRLWRSRRRSPAFPGSRAATPRARQPPTPRRKRKTSPSAKAPRSMLRRAPRHTDPARTRPAATLSVAAKVTPGIRVPLPLCAARGPCAGSPAGVALPPQSVQYFIRSGKICREYGIGRCSSRDKVAGGMAGHCSRRWFCWSSAGIAPLAKTSDSLAAHRGSERTPAVQLHATTRASSRVSTSRSRGRFAPR